MGEQSEGYQTKADPRDLKRLSRKSIIENFVSPERQKKLTSKFVSEMELTGDPRDGPSQYRSNKYLDNLKLKQERDN